MKQRFLNSIYLHLYEISRNLSKYSSANNHLIGELCGLYIGSICFPLWSECKHWQKLAKELLEEEILNQVHEDGINKEHATAYHLFTLDFFLLAYILGRKAVDAFSEKFLKRIESMLLYLNNIVTDSGDLPWFGDSDDGRAFLLSPFESNLLVTMELGGLLLSNSNFLRFSDDPSSISQAIFSKNEIDHFSSLKQSLSTDDRKSIYPDGGIGILRDEDDSLKMIFDFGQLGYKSIAAHGHADALSIVFALNNDYFLIDPGTFSYHSHPEWRSYFRSTAAHNTIRIDHQDQSIMGGRFLWTSKAKTKLLRYDLEGTQQFFEAEHDGYKRFSDPVIHRRKVEFDKDKSIFTVSDKIFCNGLHYVEIFFHLHEDSKLISHNDNSAEIHFKRSRVIFRTLSDQFSLYIVNGSTNPIMGWRSTSFHSKMPIFTLCFKGSIKTTQEIETQILINP